MPNVVFGETSGSDIPQDHGLQAWKYNFKAGHENLKSFKTYKGSIKINCNSSILLTWLYSQEYSSTFNIVAPLFITFCQMFGRHRTPSVHPFSVDGPYWPPYSTDKFISCVIWGFSPCFFHFGEEIVIAWTQEKITTLGGTEPHHSSWQCKESHRCLHWLLVLLVMGDFGTSTVLARYESMRTQSLRQREWTCIGTLYNTRDELIRVIGNINNHGRDDGVRCLPNIWQKVINGGGDYIEGHKWCTPVNKALPLLFIQPLY